jgi:hypothetical protein
MERMKEDRLDEQWKREEQQKELEKRQWRERKQQDSEEEKLKASGVRYPNRPDLEEASRSGRAWALEQQAKAEEKMKQSELMWQKKLAEEELKVKEEKEMKRAKLVELLNRQAVLEDELENLVYMVRLTEMDKYRRKMEILDELEILDVQIKNARDAL